MTVALYPGHGTLATVVRPQAKTRPTPIAAAGTYSVNLTVTDDDGATNASSRSITVSDGGTGGNVTLSSVSAYKVKGKKRWDYSWSGASTTNVDVYLDGSVATTTTNDGAYTLSTNQKGGGSHTHKVCEAGSTSACSTTVSTTF